jgi:molybdate transport system substrate-binding protein
MSAGAMTVAARAEPAPIVLFAAGSLREAMTQIAADYGAAAGVAVHTEFGPSGLLRERIEQGAHADLLASADMSHPLALQQRGLAERVAVFARNAVCAFAPAALVITTETLLDRMTGPGMRLGIAAAKADPLGDYTEEIFARADRERPGSGAVLRRQSTVVTGGALPAATAPADDPVAALLRDRRIDIYLGYCSGRARLEGAVPAVQAIALPATLRVGPEYGIALMKGAPPEAARLMLYILSIDGQRSLARHGFTAVGLPAAQEP